MHHLHLRIASLLVLLCASTAAPAAVPVDFGMLRPAGWAVGTVGGAGEGGYCALAGTYGRDVMLAFSRDVDAKGSLAVDFRQPVFDAGKSYPFHLTFPKGPDLKLTARATSKTAVMVPLVAQAPLEVFTRAGALNIEVAGVRAGFDLANLNAADLKACVDRLAKGPGTAPAPVDGVETASLGAEPMTPSDIGGRIARIARERGELAQRLETEGAQSKRLRVELQDKERDLAALKRGVSLVEGKKIEALQTEIAEMKAQREKEKVALQAELKSKEKEQQKLADQLAALKNERDSLKKEIEGIQLAVLFTPANIAPEAASRPVSKDPAPVTLTPPRAAVSSVRLVKPLTPAEVAALPQIKPETLQDIAPAAGAPASAANDTNAGFASKILANHIPGPVSLEALSKSAGLSVHNFRIVDKTPFATAAQWTAGRLNALFEQAPAEPGFNVQITDYLERYYKDCPTLSVRVAPVEAAKAGSLATAEMECTAAANSYTAALLFLRDANGFHAFIYSAALPEKDAALAARDRMVAALKSAPSFVAPQAIAAAKPAPPLKFNLQPPDDFETVVIQ